VDIKNLNLEKFNLYAKRYENKKISFENLIVKKQQKTKRKKNQKKQKPYRIKISKAKIKHSNVYFKDYTLNKPTSIRLRNINVYLNGIDSKKRTLFRYAFYARLNKSGIIKIKGGLRHTPLRTKAKININKIALKDFSPYIEQKTYLKILDGKLYTDMNLIYDINKKPQMQIKGNLDLKDFELFQTFNQKDIFNLANLGVKEFKIEQNPNRAYINEVDIDGMYVDAFIDKNKTINFAKLMKKSQQKEVKKEDDNATGEFPFQIATINIKNSNATFADFSLPIKFKTDIHDMEGNIYAVSNAKDEVSYINLKGVVDKYGSMKLKGNIQTKQPKKYTDMALSFRNLNLHSLSGYSAEFAGYKIKKGKLFLDLAYKINDSKMRGDNSLIIKKIELGDEIEDENITKLPLGLAIALLEDNDGIIDIKMPVSGDIDNPDFKYGKLIVKTFANLIVKAVAAPFKFLGAALGIDTQKLENIDFEAGAYYVMPSEVEKLDKLNSILIKRPKISLSFEASYDAKKDKFALQTKILVAKLLKRSKIKSDKDLQNSLSIDLLEDLYMKKHSKKSLQTLQKELKLHYKKDKNKYLTEYRKKVLNQVIKDQEVSKNMLEVLAKRRFDSIKDYLVSQKGINPSRIKLKGIQEINSESDFIPFKIDIEVNK
jgi:hypothetical protein